MSDFIKVKLVQIIDESNRHIKRMLSAYKKMQSFMPLDFEKYESLTEDQIEHLDQFVFRFSKLQDSMGEKLFSTFLLNLEEDVKSKTFIDILNRLEQLGLLYREDWTYLRKLRIGIAHEYSTNTDEIIENLNELFLKAKVLYQIFVKIKDFTLENIVDKAQFENKYLLKTLDFN